jgi:hypothetical protein
MFRVTVLRGKDFCQRLILRKLTRQIPSMPTAKCILTKHSWGNGTQLKFWFCGCVCVRVRARAHTRTHTHTHTPTYSRIYTECFAWGVRKLRVSSYEWFWVKILCQHMLITNHYLTMCAVLYGISCYEEASYLTPTSNKHHSFVPFPLFCVRKPKPTKGCSADDDFCCMVSVNMTLAVQLKVGLRHVGWQEDTIVTIILRDGLAVLVHRLGLQGHQMSCPLTTTCASITWWAWTASKD